MKRVTWTLCLLWMWVGVANAQMMVLKADSGTTTTGELLDGTRNLGITTNVVEIPGLRITARSGATNQEINATTSGFGINSDGSGDETVQFEVGESMVLSFDRDIRIHQFDFKGFESNETFTVAVPGMPVVVVGYDDLANKTTDVFNTNLLIGANTEIECYTTGGSVIGLDGIELSVSGASGAPSITLIPTNGMASVVAVFSEAPTTNYVLQQIGDLAESNGWKTVSVPFSSGTNWMFDTSNGAGFYRVVPE